MSHLPTLDSAFNFPNKTHVLKINNANVDAWNKECRCTRRSKLSYLSEASIREYLKKLGLAELAKRSFQRVHNNTSQRDGLEANKALINALNLCLPNEQQVYDLILFAGSYKKVSDQLHGPFKAARTAKQATIDEYGNMQEVKVAQLGILSWFQSANQFGNIRGHYCSPGQ